VIQVRATQVRFAQVRAGQILREHYALQERLDLWILLAPLVPPPHALAEDFHVTAQERAPTACHGLHILLSGRLRAPLTLRARASESAE